MFHYLFPPLTIGLGIILVYLKGMSLRTSDPIYDTAARFWTRIFGLNFAMGVATGIVMEFEFGTNWAAYSRYVGDVFGSALAAEGVFAFFLESGFLAVLLFGWDRVGPRTHFFATFMVALGGIFSSIWIVIANSWMQTPAGYTLRDHVINGHIYQRAEIVDFWGMVFNPSSIGRLVHVWLGAFLLGAAFVMSISSWYLLKERHLEFAKRSFSGGLWLATFASVAQLASGHNQASGVALHQPAKLAAMEGVYKTEPAPLYMFGLPNDEEQRVRFGVGVPGGLSFLVHGDFTKPVDGFDKLEPIWGKAPTKIVFISYHMMIGIGMIFLIATLLSNFLRWRGSLYNQRWLLWFFVFAVVLAMIANETGWVTAEVGRQPWIVYPQWVNGQLVGGLRTSQGLSEAVRADQVLSSIIMFSLIYCILGLLWITLLHQKISHGPDEPDLMPEGATVQNLLDAASKRPDHSATMTEAK
jgi:cytochrome bd ubiquinol oxidase subunit I